MRSPKIGDEVRILFTDHIKNSDQLVRDFVWGRVAKVSVDSITVDAWGTEDPDKERNLGSEVECYTIHRKSIHRIWKTTRWEEF